MNKKLFNIFLILTFLAGIGLLIFGQYFSGGEISISENQKVSGFSFASMAGMVMVSLPLIVVFGETIKKIIKK